MRLAFVTPEFVTEPYFSGGLANYLGRVTVALAERGHEVEVFTRAEQPGEIDYRGVRVRRVVPMWDRRMLLDHADPWVPRSLYNTYQDLKAAWCLAREWRRVHRRQPFDLVQTTNVQSAGLFFRRVRDVPVVVRLSSYRPAWDHAAGVRQTRASQLRWKMEERTVRQQRFIYAPSHFVAGEVAKAYGLPSVEVVETPFFQPSQQQDFSEFDRVARGRDYALFFGRLTQMKGVHILAAAMPQVFERYPNLRLLLIGDDAPSPTGSSMREYVRNTVGEKWAGNLTFLDPLVHEKLYPFVENAKFVVLPSLIDNLPNTCLEAMGLGQVVIATKGSCFEQLIHHGRSGILAPAGDSAALADGMLAAANLSDSEREQMGAAARERIADLHPSKAIPRLLAYYQQVLHEFHGRRWDGNMAEPPTAKAASETVEATL